MKDAELHTTTLHNLLGAMERGVPLAREELCRRIEQRMRRLCRKMLADFPRLQKHEEADDVLQGAWMRLLRSLQEIRPGSVREFIGLAAEQVRRELLDLTRRYNAQRRPILTQFPAEIDSAQPGFEPAAEQSDTGEWDRWCSFHAAVPQLPAAEREVVSLIFYHGWTQQEVADLLELSERQVRRHWASACVRLRTLVQGDLPQA